MRVWGTAVYAAVAASLLLPAVGAAGERDHEKDHGKHYGWQHQSASHRHDPRDCRHESHSPPPSSEPSSSGEPTLQQLFNQHLGPGVLDVGTDATIEGNDAYWQAQPGATTNLLFEFAGYAPLSIFGIYDSSSPTSILPLFYGHAGPGAATTLSVANLGAQGYRFTVTSNGVTESALFGSSVFGFYLRTPGDNVYFSDTDRNADDFDHLSAYMTSPANWLLAWEDKLNGGDRDYNDLVVAFSGINPAFDSSEPPLPTPIPGALWLFGSGVAGLMGFARRRKRA